MKTEREIEQMKIDIQEKVWEILELLTQHIKGVLPLSQHEKYLYEKESSDLTAQYIVLCEVLR